MLKYKLPDDMLVTPDEINKLNNYVQSNIDQDKRLGNGTYPRATLPDEIDEIVIKLERFRWAVEHLIWGSPVEVVSIADKN